MDSLTHRMADTLYLAQLYVDYVNDYHQEIHKLADGTPSISMRIEEAIKEYRNAVKEEK